MQTTAEQGTTIEQGFFSIDELAKYVGVSRKFVVKHVENRRIPGAVKVGRVWRFRISEVEKRLHCGELLLPQKKANRVH